jgi:tetratricopeptide (TPR) repeat protein
MSGTDNVLQPAGAGGRMSERIEAMKQFIEQFPENPFPRYALAMEYKNGGQPELAAETFRTLMEKLPAYVPTYLQFGMLLEQQGQIEEARTVLTKGVEAARAAGDNHALSEIQGVLSGLD